MARHGERTLEKVLCASLLVSFAAPAFAVDLRLPDSADVSAWDRALAEVEAGRSDDEVWHGARVELAQDGGSWVLAVFRRDGSVERRRVAQPLDHAGRLELLQLASTLARGRSSGLVLPTVELPEPAPVVSPAPPPAVVPRPAPPRPAAPIVIVQPVVPASVAPPEVLPAPPPAVVVAPSEALAVEPPVEEEPLWSSDAWRPPLTLPSPWVGLAVLGRPGDGVVAGAMPQVQALLAAGFRGPDQPVGVGVVLGFRAPGARSATSTATVFEDSVEALVAVPCWLGDAITLRPELGVARRAWYQAGYRSQVGGEIVRVAAMSSAVASQVGPLRVGLTARLSYDIDRVEGSEATAWTAPSPVAFLSGVSLEWRP